MNSNEIIRLRRQMQRRIRDVVAERRLSRQDPAQGEIADTDAGTPRPQLPSEESLIAG